MVKFTAEQMREMMDHPSHIRCLSVIAHVDHGKSTLTDSLVSKAGIIAAKNAGDARFTDTRQDEQDRCITIKSTGISMYFEYDIRTYFRDMADGMTDAEKAKHKETATERWIKTIKEDGPQKYLINLIDSPGHVDFSSEVTAALRVTDGALVVVDCIEGVCVQTETVLRQALSELIKPVLHVNKLDRVFLELHLDPEEAYQSFNKAIETVNVVIATYQNSVLLETQGLDMQVHPEEGTVSFGSGLQQWAFTLRSFAIKYAAKFGMPVRKLMGKLWGDNFYNPETNKFTRKNKNHKLDRCFVQFIMHPIQKMIAAVIELKKNKKGKFVYRKLCANMGIVLKKEELEWQDSKPKALLKAIMQKWMPAAESLLEMIVAHLPAPNIAQFYRVGGLYEGPIDDECAVAIKHCAADTITFNGEERKAPLMMYISKMIPVSQKSARFYAFGRVFSGTVKAGQKARLMTPDYVPGGKAGLYKKSIQRVVIMMGRYTEDVNSIPAGNTCALVGVDQYIIKTGTISTSEVAHTLKDMKYSVSPVVRVSVKCKDGKDLPKLVEGLKRLSKSDPLVVCTTEEKTGESIIACAGELHLEICLKDLQEDFMNGAPIVVDEPVVSYCETAMGEMEAGKTVMGKSANKHNKLYVWGGHLTEELVEAIDPVAGDAPTVGAMDDMMQRSKVLQEVHGWHKDDAKKIWAFGPNGRGANLMLERASGAQYLNEIKDSVKMGFQNATGEGPIVEEEMRGVQVNVMDVTLHADAIHRGMGQIMPTSRRACYAAMLKSEPAIMEPIFKAEISVPESYAGAVYPLLAQKMGVVVDDKQQLGTPMKTLVAHLPVAQSFGFTGDLRAATGGKAFPQMVFSHWAIVQGDMYSTQSSVNHVITAIRKRKGMKIVGPVDKRAQKEKNPNPNGGWVPDYTHFEDRM